MTDAKVLTRGVRPDAPEMSLSYTLEFDGLVESLGDDLNFKIGQLSGVPEMLPENERNRLLDVMLPFINQESHNLVVKAPEGYKFDEASVEALARNISDVTAQFVASPKINENGDLQLKTMLRLKHADLPLTFWPRLLNVLDEAASFGTASVILVKK